MIQIHVLPPVGVARSWRRPGRLPCFRFADDHRILVEPACGASLAAGYQRAEPLIGPQPVLFIVCGGAGVSRALLEKWDREVRG